MSEKRLAGWAASSQNPEEISNRVRGAVTALSSIIILVAATFFQVQLNASDVIQLGTSLGAIVGLIWSLYGALIALVTWFAQVKNTTV